MSHRKLTEGCLMALRGIAAAEAGSDIYNRTAARNLRVVEKVFPEFISIVPAPPGRGPIFSARLTERGLAFITPKKITRSRQRHHGAESHA